MQTRQVNSLLITLVLTNLLRAFNATDNDDLFPQYAKLHRDWCPSAYCPRNDSDRRNPCCSQCDCHEICEVYGTCCISVFSSFKQMETSFNAYRYSCGSIDYYEENGEPIYPKTGYSMIAKCLSSSPDELVENLCENPDVDVSIYSIIPVTDGKKHFRNQYCAMCNDDTVLTELVAYTTSIGCKSPVAFTYDKMKQIITDESRECNVTFSSPIDSDAVRCIPSLISTCNVTGLWQKYDELTERACKSFVDAFNQTYQNIFCYLCNSDTDVMPDQKECVVDSTDEHSVSSVNPPFLAILDLDSVSRDLVTKAIECNVHTQFADEKLEGRVGNDQEKANQNEISTPKTEGVCRDKLCDQSRYLSYTSECVPIPDYMDPLCYVMFFKIIPDPSDIPQQQLKTLLKTFLSKAIGNNGLSEVELYSTTMASDAPYFVIKTVTEGTSNVLDLFRHLDEANIFIGTGISISLKLMFYDLAWFHGKSIVEVPGENSTNKDILKQLPLSDVEMLNDCTDKDQVHFDTLLGCPFIKIKINEMPIRFEEDVLLFHNVNETKLSPIEFRRDNASVSICLSRFIELYNALPSFMNSKLLKEEARFQDEFSAKNVLSLACVCLSILCLLATICLFLLRKDFHSLPGYNTLVLCIFLLLAQIVYQFGVGQTTLPYWACTLIGMVCHLLWLCVMFAMNVCSLDMFIIFRKLMVTKHKHSWIRTIKRLVYIVIISLVFVTINVVVSLLRSGDGALGYGGIICYISSKLMQIVTFIVPSVVTIVANISFFIYVVLQIKSSTIHSGELQQERNYLTIYARLSTLTGFTWLIGFLLILVQSEVLEYIFILLNASQGIFIMIAFSVNKNLWKICCPEKDVTTRSSRITD